MFYYSTSQVQRRIGQKANHNYSITDYGYDNLYPQLMDELHKKSPLTKQAIKVLSEFSMGDGWTGNGDKVVNELGQTFNDMLRLCAQDLNTFVGFAMHFNFDGAGRIAEINHIPFEYVRLGIKDERTGRTSYCMVSNNWEQQSDKFKTYKGLEPVRYDLFNPKTAALNALEGSNGQVLYWTPQMFSYPLASFDAVRDSVQTDAEIQTFMLSNIQNGFLGSTVFKYPGGFDNEDERKNVTERVNKIKGSGNANSIIIAETPEDFTSSIIEAIPAPNNDKLFEQTGNKVMNVILQNFGVPGPLLAVNPQGSVFTQEQIRDSYILMNLRTQNQRKVLERTFAPIGKLFGSRLGEIEQIPWEIPGMNMPELNGDPNQLQEGGENENQGAEAERENRKAQANLRGSVGGVQGILQTQASVVQGVTDYEAGVTILVEIYGFDDPTARKLLGPKKALEEEEETQEVEEEMILEDG